ncbi:MAG: YhcH/YjgK/YiaL family protein [Ignavibacteriae bacterium]|nr:YhcH/YjgK/YiaL family protein [Ignavibacteriota bacterium]
MVLDVIENSKRYVTLHPHFRSVLETLSLMKTVGSENLVIDGEMVYIIFSQQVGKRREEVFLEAHKKYIDIHFCFEGEEEIGWRAVQHCISPDKPYDEEKDFMTFTDKPESWLSLSPGSFAIFFPEDAHALMVSDGLVKKAVVKVAV